ncbi:MAG TPA: helix-turn-helix domain-containing protein [Bryobacteraceae bacterium]|nr:helix-turn-helix domain-containing protein [Bryobacteraceae bacterium]
MYACLELATMAFHQELAVTMEGGKQRPLTPADISHQTGLSKQHTRRALAELEAEGLVERRAADGGRLRNGQILIYSWAEPRKAGTQKGSRARLPFPHWFPEPWEPLKPLITRLKLQVSINEVAARDYLQQGAEAARSYQKAEKVAREFLERVCARPPSNKEERTERKIERKSGLSVGQKDSRRDRPTDSSSPEAEIQKLPQVRRLSTRLKDTPSPQLYADILRALAGAPLADLDARIALRFEKITSLGMLVKLAGDVGRAHAAREAERQADQRAHARQMERQRQALIADLRAHWSELSDEDRDYYRREIPELRAAGAGA